MNVIGLDQVIGHARAIDALAALAEASAPVPPLLFAGPDGVGKRTAALAFAAALLCARTGGRGACGSCGPCLRVRDAAVATEIGGRASTDAPELYPDVGLIGVPEKKTRLSIQQARDIAHSMSQRPFELSHRVYVIDDAERLTTAAANALLKLLEEPPLWAVLILVTSSPWSLPVTIRSRIRTVRFGLLTIEEIIRVLEHAGIDRDDARARARLAAGSAGAALALEPEREAARVDLLVNVLMGLAAGRPAGELAVAAGESFGESPQAADAALTTLLVLLRDIAASAAGAPPLRLDAARATALVPALDTLAGPALARIAAIESIRAELTVYNRNPRLAVEGAVLALAGRMG